METNENEEMAVAYVSRREAVELGGRDGLSAYRRRRFKVIPDPTRSSGEEISDRGTRIALLVSSAAVAIVGALAVWLLRRQLGVDPVTAARAAASMVGITLALFFWGLYRITVKSQRHSSKERAFNSLSEISLAEYKTTSTHRARLAWIIILLLHLGWLMPVAGILVAVFGPTGITRIGGLTTGAGLGALTLFIRSTALPIYRHADESTRRIRQEYLRGLKSQGRMEK